MSIIKAIGRVFLASMFISGGANSFMNPEPPSTRVADAGIPSARQATILDGALMVVAGFALAIGIAPRLAAAVLAATLVPTTFVGHPFWKEEAPGSRVNQRIHFWKNLSMLGGLLLVVAGYSDDDEE